MAKKKEYVTREEFDRVKSNLFLAIMIAFIGSVVIGLIITIATSQVSSISTKELYCAHNETGIVAYKVPYSCDGHGNKEQYGIFLCYSIEVKDVTTNRCLDWRLRDKV